MRSPRPIRLALWLLVALAVAGGAGLWHKVIRHQLFPRNFGVVRQGQVYRSGQLSPRQLERVCRERDIRTIIALNGRDEAVAAEHERARELGVDHLVFSMSGDGRGDPAEYARVVEIMADPARQPVLVHCAAGAQRTSVAVILYRHLIEGMPIAEAYPESFEYKHRPGQWELPAFLADTLPAIEEAYRGPAPEPQERAEAGTPDDPP